MQNSPCPPGGRIAALDHDELCRSRGSSATPPGSVACNGWKTKAAVTLQSSWDERAEKCIGEFPIQLDRWKSPAPSSHRARCYRCSVELRLVACGLMKSKKKGGRRKVRVIVIKEEECSRRTVVRN